MIQHNDKETLKPEQEYPLIRTVVDQDLAIAKNSPNTTENVDDQSLKYLNLEDSKNDEFCLEANLSSDTSDSTTDKNINEIDTSTVKDKSAKKNVVFNVLYKLTLAIPPLILVPYLARTLGPSKLGDYEFIVSISQYFSLFAGLGVAYYGQREIAKHRGDRGTQTKVFFEIIIFRFIFVLISLLVDVVLILSNVYGARTMLMWFCLIRVFSVGCDISFMFTGNENFAIFFVRNLIIRSISLFAIIYFVKSEDDLLKYALIVALEAVITNASIIPYLKKYLCRFKGKLKIWSHATAIFRLFIPSLAVNLYTTINKTAIGLIKLTEDVAYFTQGEKIISMCLVLITSITPVLIPRMVKAYKSKNSTQANQFIQKSLKFMFFITAPLMFGIIAISRIFVPFFLSESYNPTIIVLMILPFAIFPLVISNVLGMQYLIPSNKDKEFSVSIVAGAITSICLSILLTYLCGFIGTTIAYILTEICVTVVQMYYAKKDISPIQILKYSVKYLIVGFIMFVGVFATSFIMKPNITGVSLLILESAMIYVLGMIITKDEIFLEILKMMKTVFRRNTIKKQQ
ncbi:MAG: flippase [Christensenellaceae bacterium]|jgi:O-antigen/teichoic acid export membrane protein|nr:flippase [Christensenellaceae bacterium]